MEKHAGWRSVLDEETFRRLRLKLMCRAEERADPAWSSVDLRDAESAPCRACGSPIKFYAKADPEALKRGDERIAWSTTIGCVGDCSREYVISADFVTTR
jgi:hypothetical protein